MSGPLASVQQQIIASSGEELHALKTYLAAQEELLIQHMPQLDDLLPSLDPALHTLGLVFILHCKATAVPLSNAQAVSIFLAQCRRMLLGCDPVQVRMVPAQFVAVCMKFSTAAITTNQPLAAVKPLLAAALALQPTPRHFTPLHAEFAKCCLLARCYLAAAPLLSQDLISVEKEATHLAPRDLLLWHYYAGMLHVGMHEYKLAITLFTLCYSAPTHVVSAIMVEAYKKAMLCSLILDGEPPRPTKHVGAVVTRHITSKLTPYTELAEAFASRKLPELQAAVTKHAAVLTHDKNLGLARQCLPALTRRAVRLLTETYLTLSLGQIAELVGLESAEAAEKVVREMIVGGAICASIDEPKALVFFHESPEHYDSHATVVAIEGAMDRVVGVAGKLQDLYAQVATDTNYLTRSATSQERGQPFGDETMLAK